MFKKQSIFKKLIFNTLPISIIPFILLLVILFHYTCGRIESQERNAVWNSLNSYIRSIDTEKANAILKSDYIITNSEIRTLLEQDADDLYDRLLLIDSINSYTQIINGQNIDTITIYTDNPSILMGRFTNSIDNLSNLAQIRQKLSETEYTYFDDTVNYDEVGRAYIRLFRKLFANNEIIIEVKVYIPKEEGFIIAHEGDTRLDDPRYLSSPITPTSYAITTLNSDELSSQYFRYGLIFFLIGLFFCAVIIYATIMITSKTTNTINEYITTLAESDIPQAFSNDETQNDSYELRVIKKTINRLIDNIKESSKAHYKTELEKKRLELNLLQSKIDPHILYNSLAAISHKAFLDKDDELSLLVENLTNYYRLSLARGRDFTTVKEEIELIEKFVAVNEVSHSQKYEFCANISDDIKDENVLHLMLQPFAENCIVHGLAGKKQECRIKIDCYKENDMLVFKIFDNGYGITEEKLKKLNDTQGLTDNYGIKNSFDRMRLFYGDKCSLKFESERGKYTLVTIMVPQHRD